MKNKTSIIKRSHSKYESGLTPEFKIWRDRFMDENKELLQRLADHSYNKSAKS